MVKKIKIEWKGKSFSIPEDRWFEVAEEVEEVFNIFDINNFAARPRLAKLARAYTIMINFAGCDATQGEVYRDIKQQLGDAKNKAAPEQILVARALIDLTSLLLGVMPETDEATTNDGGKGEKKIPRRRAKSS